MSRLRFAAQVAATVAALVIASCGGSDLRKTYPVKGTISVDGNPAPAGVVVKLIPQFTETDRLPIHPKADTDAAGQFQITTYNTADGAPEGDYVATVEWPQRIGLSPHFSGDLFGGAFAKPDANKARPEFVVKVGKDGANLDLKLTLTAEQKRAVDAGLKKAQQQNASMMGGP